MQQPVRGLAYLQVSPFPLFTQRVMLFRHGCFLVEKLVVDLPEVMQTQCPFACLVEGCDVGEFLTPVHRWLYRRRFVAGWWYSGG